MTKKEYQQLLENADRAYKLALEKYQRLTRLAQEESAIDKARVRDANARVAAIATAAYRLCTHLDKLPDNSVDYREKVLKYVDLNSELRAVLMDLGYYEDPSSEW